MQVLPLGKNQRRIINRMENEGLVIRVVRDICEQSEDISLMDEQGDNYYEKLSGEFLESLWKRKLLSRTVWIPALNIEIITFRIKR